MSVSVYISENVETFSVALLSIYLYYDPVDNLKFDMKHVWAYSGEMIEFFPSLFLCHAKDPCSAT